MDQTFELAGITADNTEDRVAALVAAARTQVNRIRQLKTKPTEDERRLTEDLVEKADYLVEVMQEFVDEGRHRQAQLAATDWQQRNVGDIRRAKTLTETGRLTMMPVVQLSLIISEIPLA
jgi:ethanolamine ammonia-lyase large subunit